MAQHDQVERVADGRAARRPRQPAPRRPYPRLRLAADDQQHAEKPAAAPGRYASRAVRPAAWPPAAPWAGEMKLMAMASASGRRPARRRTGGGDDDQQRAGRCRWQPRASASRAASWCVGGGAEAMPSSAEAISRWGSGDSCLMSASISVSNLGRDRGRTSRARLGQPERRAWGR